MKNTAFRVATAFSALLLVSIPAAAQQTAAPEGTEVSAPADAAKTDKKAEEKKAEEETTDVKILKERPITMQHFRPVDRRGINMFETPKEPGVEYTGFKMDWNAAFTSCTRSAESLSSRAT